MTTHSILIVDDEYDIRAVAELALKAVGGWQVITAASGSEGLIKAEQNSPDAILLDVMMPEMDGIAVLQALQANPITRSIPVIFLTAKVQASDQKRFQELGVKGVITKPFKAMKLPNQMSQILGWT
ncbi:response regulator [Leptolyngbya sp. AN03gr2]|uniref:response regulator n=1 Tax=unclassified Leptolyngbya TaxID=2650499 RepID=UPI003D32010F